MKSVLHSGYCMELSFLISWFDKILETSRFDDVSNNGLQIGRSGEEVRRVAFAVDASLASVRSAAAAGADLLVVHHGISWGGGIKRLTEVAYEVVSAAIKSNLALAAYHLPLDANRAVGNNWELARLCGLSDIEMAFSYHGNIIGVTGWLAAPREIEIATRKYSLPKGKIGICSGGAGDFVVDAKRLGCVMFLTGETSWADVIAAENVSMPFIAAGHYETETFGVRALSRLLSSTHAVETVWVGREG